MRGDSKLNDDVSRTNYFKTINSSTFDHDKKKKILQNN